MGPGLRAERGREMTGEGPESASSQSTMAMLPVSVYEAACDQPHRQDPQGKNKVPLELSSAVGCSITFFQCPYCKAPPGCGFGSWCLKGLGE